jgi:hypothetical protein
VYPLSPVEVRSSYACEQVSGDDAGQTLAIVDAHVTSPAVPAEATPPSPMASDACFVESRSTEGSVAPTFQAAAEVDARAALAEVVVLLGAFSQSPAVADEPE